MLSSRLIELIETHADRLTQQALTGIATNPRTRSFRLVAPDELEARIFATYHNLGQWVCDPDDDAVRAEYERWGARRRNQEIPLSEVVYALIIVKQRLHAFVRDHGLLDVGGDRAVPAEFIGLQLYGIQELNAMVGDFFDRATYALACGYEQETAALTLVARGGRG
jgi:hypothetical protein